MTISCAKRTSKRVTCGLTSWKGQRHGFVHKNVLLSAYIQFVLALAAKAISARAASSRKREFNPESAKYDLCVLLLRLGMIGDEFKTARMHLMANMPGDAAFKTREQRIKHTAKRNAQAAEAAAAPPTTANPE